MNSDARYIVEQSVQILKDVTIHDDPNGDKLLRLSHYVIQGLIHACGVKMTGDAEYDLAKEVDYALDEQGPEV